MRKERTIIRKGKLDDYRELYSILNNEPELRSSSSGEEYNKEWVSAASANEGENISLIAENNREIQGFLIGEFDDTNKYSYAYAIYVKPSFREKGLGNRLLKEFEKIAKEYGIERSLTFVLVSNKKVQKFVEKRGYKKGQSMYHYEKELK